MTLCSSLSGHTVDGFIHECLRLCSAVQCCPSCGLVVQVTSQRTIHLFHLQFLTVVSVIAMASICLHYNVSLLSSQPAVSVVGEVKLLLVLVVFLQAQHVHIHCNYYTCVHVYYLLYHCLRFVHVARLVILYKSTSPRTCTCTLVTCPSSDNTMPIEKYYHNGAFCT